MLKKLIGYFLLLIGIFCALSILGNILRLTTTVKSSFRAEPFEIFMAILLTVVIGFFCFKYGIKWISKQPETQSSIEDIGTHDAE